jgi:hypothetical protein
VRHTNLAIALLALCALPARAGEVPPRKPGLWELTVTQANVPTRTGQHCTDETTEKTMSLIWWHPDQQRCSRPDVVRDGGTITVDRMCTLGGRKTAEHAVITGDLGSAYRVELTIGESIDAQSTVVTEGSKGLTSRKGPFVLETRMTIEARWLGACKVYMVPGEMFFAYGKRHIREWPHLLAPDDLKN